MSSKLNPTESQSEFPTISPTVLEGATSPSVVRVPIYTRFGAWAKKTVVIPPARRWLDARKAQHENKLRQLESKSSNFLAECANLTITECLERFNSSFSGLHQSQIQSLIAQYGENVLSTAKPRRWWSILLECLPNPFNILLTVLAIISIATQQTATFVILMAMVFLSVSLRFWQELKNVRALNELVMLIQDSVQVVREGVKIEIPKTHIVPGDLVVLTGGDIVAADIVLIDTSGLYISQSTLTGETLPVLKQLSSIQTEAEGIFEAPNVCFAGTNIVSGTGTGLVVATGDKTYIGTLSASLSQSRGVNDFERGVRRISYMLMGFMMVMVPIVLVISGLVSKDWGSAALFCISVAVGITPEMLPMILNANLCRGALKLAKLKVIVKKLDSVQSLGAMDILCSDKTGTLTKDDITLQRAVDANNRPSNTVLQYAYLNAVNQEGLRNSIDTAIVHHVHNVCGEEMAKISEEHLKIGEIAFDFERRLLSIIVRDSSNRAIMITKGAVEEVLRKCTHLSRGEMIPMTKSEDEELMKLCIQFNEQGSRTIAVASRQVDETDVEDLQKESGLTFEGFLTFLDPPKDDAREAIQHLYDQRVGVKVLTGDNAAAARTAAIKIGLLTGDESDKVISGPELAQLSESALEDVAERCVVFAKLKPLQKQEVISALRRKGHVVGFLGDGINDAPALHNADVGISVDTGTTVVKHAADIILLQKSLTHVVNGVQYGRITHANTMKYIKMVASSNFGNIFSVTVAAGWLPFVPMNPLQLLVQNLLYDFSQASIPWDHVDPEMTEAPATWRVWSIVRFNIWFGPTSSIFDIVTFLLGWYYYGIQTANNTQLVEVFQTHWFLEGLLTQLFVVIMLRTQHIPLIQSRPAKPMAAALVLIAAVGMSLPYIPGINSALKMQHPRPTFYGFLAAILTTYILLVQLVKVIYKRIYKQWI